MAKLSLILPCYNESENLPLLISKLNDAFVDLPNIEVILVNNGSQDNTTDILATSLKMHPFIRSVTVTTNQGYGYGILQGLKVARGDYLGWMHADLQCDPKDIRAAVKMIEQAQSPIFIKGNRYGRSLLDLIFTLGMSIFCSTMFRCKLWDINAQPNIFPRDFYNTWRNPPMDFSLDLFAYVSAQKAKLPMNRFPVFFGKRMAGEAHLSNFWDKLKYSYRTMDYSLKFFISDLF